MDKNNIRKVMDDLLKKHNITTTYDFYLMSKNDYYNSFIPESSKFQRIVGVNPLELEYGVHSDVLANQGKELPITLLPLNLLGDILSLIVDNNHLNDLKWHLKIFNTSEIDIEYVLVMDNDYFEKNGVNELKEGLSHEVMHIIEDNTF